MAEYFTPTFFAPESNIRKALKEGQMLTDRPTCLIESNILVTAHKLLIQAKEKRFMDFAVFLLSERCTGHRLVWAGDYAEVIKTSPNTENNVYGMKTDSEKAKYTDYLLESVKCDGTYDFNRNDQRRIILNLDRKEYIVVPDEYDYHPLPFLTFDGEIDSLLKANIAEDMLGRWCGEPLKASDGIPDGFTEIYLNIPPLNRWKRKEKK